MKRLYIIVLLVSVAFFKAQIAAAQEFTKEITISWSGTPYGDEDKLLYYNDRMSLTYNPLDYMFSDYDGPTYTTGNFIAEINFLRGRRWTFSLAFAANGLWKDCYDSMTDEHVGRISGFSATVMPQARFNWINSDVLKIYSSVGLGLSVGSFDRITRGYGAYQLGIIGLQVGRRFFVFGEAGLGSVYMGGKGGVGYRF